MISLFQSMIVLVTMFFQMKESHPIEKVWFNGDKTAKIQIYKNGGHFEGKIIWLKEPKNEKGEIKTDIHNPNESMRKNTVIGLVVMKNMKEKEKGSLDGGTIYDPKSGKTYSCKITIKDAQTIDLRGFIGISLLGRTEKWTSAD